MSWNVAWSLLFYVFALKAILMARAVCPASASDAYRAILPHGGRRHYKRSAAELYLGAASGSSPLVSVRRLVPRLLVYYSHALRLQGGTRAGRVQRDR